MYPLLAFLIREQGLGRGQCVSLGHLEWPSPCIPQKLPSLTQKFWCFAETTERSRKENSPPGTWPLSGSLETPPKDSDSENPS